MAKKVIMMMGYPGSGKTTYINNSFTGKEYTIIHGDDHKTESKMRKAFISALQSQDSSNIVLDATHASKVKRLVFISIAKQYTNDISLIHMNTSLETSLKRNFERVGDKQVPRIALFTYRKRFEEPSIEEGFSNIEILEEN